MTDIRLRPASCLLTRRSPYYSDFLKLSQSTHACRTSPSPQFGSLAAEPPHARQTRLPLRDRLAQAVRDPALWFRRASGRRSWLAALSDPEPPQARRAYQPAPVFPRVERRKARRSRGAALPSRDSQLYGAQRAMVRLGEEARKDRRARQRDRSHRSGLAAHAVPRPAFRWHRGGLDVPQLLAAPAVRLALPA